MRYFKADLHIHSCLSPCADIIMTAGNIINKAVEQGLDIIAITDHNSAKNVAAAVEMAAGSTLKIIPGMEVESAEGVHLLCFFDQVEQLLTWQEEVYQSLPDMMNDEEYFGYQIITDQEDEFIAKEERLLATAVKISVEDIVKKITKLGGLVVPSHIDRPYNSILANLGFIPPGMEISTLEISKHVSEREIEERFPFIKEYSLISNSDSHYLIDIKPMMEFYMGEASLSEIRLAVLGKNGRRSRIIK